MSTSRKVRIDFAKRFSRFPAGRYQEDGEFNGTEFRKNVLVPALLRFDKVEVNFDGVAGFGTSFLDEAFGGLARCEEFSRDQLNSKLKILTSEPELEDDVRLTRKLIDDAFKGP